MKNTKLISDLTKEEQVEHDALVRGGYVSVSNVEDEKKRFATAAKYTLAKKRTITLRITEPNYRKIKAAAAREGLPYQTFISSLLHKHVS
jgi:predicted DNA binding CopG/RHH family protein